MIVMIFFLILPIIVTLAADLLTPPSKKKYVLMILGTIILFIILSTPYWLFHVWRVSPAGRASAAEAMIELLSTSLDSFNEDVGRYPTTGEGISALVTPPKTISPDKWKGPYLRKELLKDPWRHDFVYTANGPNRFRLFSYGLDGTTKTGGNDEDDINNWDNKRTWRQFYAAQAAKQERMANIYKFIVLRLYPILIIFLSYRFYRFRRDNSSRKKIIA